MKRFLLLCSGILFFTFSFGQSDSAIRLDIAANDSFESFSWLDSLIPNKRMLLYGEDHRYLKFNRELELKTLQYIQQKREVTYITEFGPISNWLLDKFINEQDSGVERFFRTQFLPSYGKFYHDMRESKPDSVKIKLEGIDIQRQINETVYAMSRVLPLRPEIPDSLVLIIESLHSLHELFNQRGVMMRSGENFRNMEESPDTTDLGYFYPVFDEDIIEYGSDENYNTYATFYALFIEMKRKKEELNKYAGADSVQFNFFMEVTEQTSYWRDLNMNNNLMGSVYRERVMYNNMERMFREDTATFFFGMFGRCHTGKTDLAFECGVYKFRSFASRLSDALGTNLSDQIVSVAVFYPFRYGENDLRINSPADSLMRAVPEDQVSLIYLGNGFEKTVLNERFDWVIFNRQSNLNSSVTYHSPVTKAKDGFRYASWKTYFQLGYGLKSMHTKTFSDNQMKVKPFLHNIHASIYENEEEYTTFGGTFDYFWSMGNNRITDTSSLRFGGLKVQFFVGHDFIKSNRFDIILAGGLGYQRFTMTYEQNAPQVVNRFLPTQNSEAYVKQGLALDFIMRTNYLYHDFNFGLVGGYSLDASGRKWKYNGTKVDSGIRANAGGFYLNAVIGFWI